MKNFKPFLKVSSVFLVTLAFSNLVACNKPKPVIAGDPTPAETFVPKEIEATPVPTPTPVPASPNTFIAKFAVKRGLVDDWQAKGIVVSGDSIFVSATDSTGILQKGTILKISKDGKTQKDFASSWLTLRHPMDKTVGGLTLFGSNLLAVDTAGKFYVVDSSKGAIKTIKTDAATDIASGGGAVFIASGSSVARTDSSASSRNMVQGMSATGGIGADKDGAVYAVSGNTIKKSDASGQVMDVISAELAAPIDVAIDDRNGDIYVLEQQEVKRFNRDGMLLTKFASQAAKASSIALDSAGYVYIADTGNSAKESQVIKFSASIDASSTNSINYTPNNVVNNYNTPAYNNANPNTPSDYNTYVASKTNKK